MSRRRAFRILAFCAFVAWAGFAFWAFSFSYSDSFFRYNLASRLPPFLAALLTAFAIPVSAAAQWRRARLGKTTAARAWWVHGLAAVASLLPLVLVSAALARAPEPWHLSGDDAMGVGIDFMVLVGLVLLSLVMLGAALALGRPRRRREGGGGEGAP